MKELKWPLMQNSISLYDKLKLCKFILSTDKFTQGKKVKEFEDEWSKWLGCKYSLYVTSGSTANFLLISAIIEKYNLKPGDKEYEEIKKEIENGLISVSYDFPPI